MAFRNVVRNCGKKEMSFMVRATSANLQDVGSPSMSGTGEAESKVNPEPIRQVAPGNFVDLEQVGDEGKGENVGVNSQISSRLRSKEGKRTQDQVSGPSVKRIKKDVKLKSVEATGNTEEETAVVIKEKTEESAKKKGIPPQGVFSNMPTPEHCHKVMGAIVPSGWVRQINASSLDLHADACSQALMQTLALCNAMNGRVKGVVMDQERDKALVGELRDQVREKDVELEKARRSVDELPEVILLKAEVEGLRKSMYEQGEEMSKVRLERDVAKLNEEKLGKQLGELGNWRDDLLLQVDAEKKRSNEIISHVIPHVCKKLFESVEFGELLGDYVNWQKILERSTLLKDLADAGRIVIGEDDGYDEKAYNKMEAAEDRLANATFPYLQNVAAHLDDLLAIVPEPAAPGSLAIAPMISGDVPVGPNAPVVPDALVDPQE